MNKTDQVVFGDVVKPMFQLSMASTGYMHVYIDRQTDHDLVL